MAQHCSGLCLQWHQYFSAYDGSSTSHGYSGVSTSMPTVGPVLQWLQYSSTYSGLCSSVPTVTSVFQCLQWIQCPSAYSDLASVFQWLQWLQYSSAYSASSTSMTTVFWCSMPKHLIASVPHCLRWLQCPSYWNGLHNLVHAVAQVFSSGLSTSVFRCLQWLQYLQWLRCTMTSLRSFARSG